MKRTVPLLIALAALACCPAAFSQAPAQDSTVARDLRKLRVPGKVGAVLWTRRDDRLTLQIVPASSGNALRQVAKPDPNAKSFVERLQVWMLRADGTMIRPTGFATPKRGKGREAPVIEVLYAFPLSANQEAVAVAMQFDGQFYIQELESFPSQ